MLHVSLYNNKSDGEILNKQLVKLTDKEVAQYDDMVIEAPILILSGMSAETLERVNYVYITEFNRYYDCIPELLSDGNYQLTCSVDPLMSFKSDILSLTCVIGSQVNEKNDDINDGSKTCQVNGFIQRINWGDSFEGQGINILICAGGGAAPSNS